MSIKQAQEALSKGWHTHPRSKYRQTKVYKLIEPRNANGFKFGAVLFYLINPTLLQINFV